MVRHGPDDYKTGGAYGERPALVIDSRVYPALESWLNVHRRVLSPTHDFVFTRPNGTPWTVSELSRRFPGPPFDARAKRPILTSFAT